MSPKDLAKYIALCRKAGVLKLKMDGFELELGPEPTKAKSPNKPIDLPNFDPGNITPFYHSETVEPNDQVTTDVPDEETLLFYSSDAPQEVN